jgi:hypothetical protein
MLARAARRAPGGPPKTEPGAGAWKVYGVRAPGPHGDDLPSFSRDLNMFVTGSSDGRGGLQ